MISNITTRLITLFILIARCSLTFGQLYNFTNYSIDQGLPQSTVYCIHEDQLGYLWIGTENGVARFDGNEFVRCEQSPVLTGNIRSIIEGPDQTIWIGSDKGIAIYNGLTWKTITAENGLQGSSIMKMKMDQKKRVWAATNDAGINIITINDSIKIDHLNDQNGLAKNFVFDILNDSISKRTWVAMIGGINIVTEDSVGFNVEYLPDSIIIPSNYITCIDKDEHGDLWFGTLDAGAFKLIERNGSYSVDVFGPSKGITDPKIWNIRCMDNQVWFASNDNGFYVLEKGLMQNISINNGLPGNLILTVFRDSKRNIWLGSMGNGLALFRGKTLVHYTREQGLPGQKILAVKSTKDGKIWVGSDEKGLALLNFNNDKMNSQYFDAKQGFMSHQVISLDIDNEGDLILGTRGEGLARYKNGRFYYLSTLDGIANNTVNHVCWASKGSIYVGTNLGFNEVTENKIHTISEENGLINSEVQSIISDQKGNIWMGTLGGLASFQAKTNVYRDFNEEEGLFDLRIYCLAADKYDNIWMGTSNGIFKYIVHADTIVQMAKLKLASKLVNSLLFLNDTTLIAGTNLGFNKFTFDKEIVQPLRQDSYDKMNGFKFSETNLNAISKDEKGHVWFGTIGGLTCYRPEFEDTAIVTPTVYITGVRLSFNTINWSASGLSLKPGTNLPINLSLPYNKNHLTIDYAGIYLRNPEKVVYRYKLEPYEQEWSPVTKSNSVPYPGLNNGKFTFSVIASCDGQHWSAPQVYQFTIRPPFWKTLWFYIALSLLFGCILILYIRWREKKLIREKAHLEKVVKERTAEVVAQKEEIEKQKEEITSSITYARRIQRAVLPGIDILQQNTADCFVLFKPRDIVSGDFYWMGRSNNHLLVTAADCTGHGVPGAFMSMLGVSFLNKIINEMKIDLPDQVLGHMRQNVITSLKQGEHEGSTKDGMDMALCVIDMETLMLTYAGAYNPAIVVTNNEAIELKADRMPVAHHIVMHPFTPLEMQLKKGDCIYVFSDGYQDQIGGPDCRKFMRKNLRELLLNIHQKPMCEQQQILDTTIEQWRLHPAQPKGKTDQMDDILVIGFRI